MKQSQKGTTWAGLAAGEGVTLAVDTEFEGTRTLTIQSAGRAGGGVRVQLSRAPATPPPPGGCFGTAFSGRFPVTVTVVPPKVISTDLSPARVLGRLLGLPPAGFL